jgi:hypothetical protein
MKKKMVKVFALAIVGTALVSSNALATSISYNGNFTFSDSGGSSSIQDKISFSTAAGYGLPAADGIVTNWNPPVDGLIGVGVGWEYITLTDLYLDEGNLYNFSPVTTTDGFALYDDNGDLLFEADLTAVTLELGGSGGAINSIFAMNLTNITAGVTYSLGDSSIVDSFVTAPGASANFTLQTPGDVINFINSSSSYTGSYSGTAAPVPEPASMLLLGAGLAGLGGAVRKRNKK